MKIGYDEIENAFLFVSMAPMYENQAILCMRTGKFFYLSGIGDSDDLPEDIDESDDYIEIPHKNRLDLGKSLVFQFVSEHLPGDLDQVERIFRKRGAYSRFKDLLERKNLL